MGIYVNEMQTVAETPTFTETAERILGTAGRSDLVAYLAANPGAGDLISGTGGIRKLHWRAPRARERAAVRGWSTTSMTWIIPSWRCWSMARGKRMIYRRPANASLRRWSRKSRPPERQVRTT